MKETLRAERSVVVIKLGGSVAFPGKPDTGVIKELSKYLSELVSQGTLPALVIGGGALVRSYVSPLRNEGVNDAFLDELGIMIGRLNARIVARLIGGRFVESLEQAKHAIEGGMMPVMGGLIPGQSHDAVAAVMAEYLEAKHLYILTDVGGVYDSDPKQNPSAKLVKKMTFLEMIRFCESLEAKAGNYPIFDFVGAKVIYRSKIPTTLCKFSDFPSAIREKAGTLVTNE